jgi:HAD superfamily hydrolase (TIGR01549 family)
VKINKKLIIFDLDGVLIDSRENMEASWLCVQDKFNLNIPFKEYIKHIGKPFRSILLSLGIKNNFKNIKSCYDNASIKCINKIRTYPNVLNSLKKITKKGKEIAIVTSKDKKRTNIIVKKFFKGVNFSMITTPEKKFRSKPDPDLILKTLTHLNYEPGEALYCGDTLVDFETAKKAKVAFIFATYGYAKLRFKIFFRFYKLKPYKINAFSDLLKIIL